MKIKEEVKILFRDTPKTLLIFFGILIVLLLINLFVEGFFLLYRSSTEDTFALEVFCAIFVFVIGLIVYKSEFNFALQNSIPRRTFYWSYLIFGVLFALITLAVSYLICIIYANIAPLMGANLNISIHKNSFYVFGQGFASTAFWQTLALDALHYIAIFAFAAFLTSMNYFLERIGKLVFWFAFSYMGVCGLVALGNIFDENISEDISFFIRGIVDFYTWLISYMLASPGQQALVYTIISVVFLALCYPLCQRSIVKKWS